MMNINSLRNKINDLRLIMEDINLGYLEINETKLDETFPAAQFNLREFKIRARSNTAKYRVSSH